MPRFTVKQLAEQQNLRNLQQNQTVQRISDVFRRTGWGRSVFRTRVAFAFAVVMLAGQTAASAQTLKAQLTIVSTNPARVSVKLQLPAETKVISFRSAYGATLGLADRIATVEAAKERDDAVQLQRIGVGQFRSAENFTRVSYLVNLPEPSTPAALAQTSWINRDRGLLMLSDLLPQTTGAGEKFFAVEIQFEVPRGWTIASNIKSNNGPGYLVDKPDDAVFLVGPSLRLKSKPVGGQNLSVVLSGEWPLSNDDAQKISRKLIEKYSSVTGFTLRSDATLMLIPFSESAGPESWTAETRGNTVVLLLGNKAGRDRVLSRLRILLSHELFHLWVPNSLSLTGDYDWFFEGFTLYEALRTVLRFRLISFEDFLDTIARVYKSYLAAPNHNSLSLIDASERRWTNAPSLVYDKGMLVAFIYDLELKSKTECKASSGDVYKQLFRLHSTGQGNANETIIGLLGEPAGMQSFVASQVQGTGRIDLKSLLSPYGLEVRQDGTNVKVTVASKRSDEQRRLLKCLGYRK